MAVFFHTHHMVGVLVAVVAVGAIAVVIMRVINRRGDEGGR